MSSDEYYSDEHGDNYRDDDGDCNAYGDEYSDGDVVDTWTESSAGRNATATGSQRPVFRDAGPRPFVQFDGSVFDVSGEKGWPKNPKISDYTAKDCLPTHGTIAEELVVCIDGTRGIDGISGIRGIRCVSGVCGISAMVVVDT